MNGQDQQPVRREGGVQIAQATSFNIVPNVEINGGLQINSAAGPGTVCGTQVNGNVSVSSNQAPIQVGSGGNCTSANTIGGNLTCTGNTPILIGTNLVKGHIQQCNG